MCLVLYTLTPFVPTTPMPSSNHYSIIHSLVHYKPSTNVSYYHCCCHLYPHYKRMRLQSHLPVIIRLLVTKLELKPNCPPPKYMHLASGLQPVLLIGHLPCTLGHTRYHSRETGTIHLPKNSPSAFFKL